MVIVIGGGHAGVEAAWAAANLLGRDGSGRPSIALITLDPTKIGVMSCNPAIGGLAKGQLVREVDALGGLMGLATDATGIQFKVLNTSKGAAVHGPRAQCDKHAYAQTVQRMISSRPEIEVIAGSVEQLLVTNGEVRGVGVCTPADPERTSPHESRCRLLARAVVLTTGTFMRGLMHTGEDKSRGGRFGEGAANGISDALRELGFELGRLKTGTPPRLRRGTIDWDSLAPQYGDEHPIPFSDLSGTAGMENLLPQPLTFEHTPSQSLPHPGLSTHSVTPSLSRFPVLRQVECRQTHTTRSVHELIRANLHRAPMYSGQIESIGPRYCPSIEDKVVRFAERETHGVFLEPESLRDDWVYCNGISTSLPRDVQDAMVRSMPGCEKAEILRYGYAVEYDMVRPHQIRATGETKPVRGLFLAGQINGTSGYEEAAAQGIVAGINAAHRALGLGEFVLGRDEAYIGVLMDDLVTKTPVEPYRMFTSRAEHRLLLRADNAADRLTPRAIELGLLDSTPLGSMRKELFARRRNAIDSLNSQINSSRHGGVPLSEAIRRNGFTLLDLRSLLSEQAPARTTAPDRVTSAALFTVFADRTYEAFIERQRNEIRRHAEIEHRRIPDDIDYDAFSHLRAEARTALARFRPSTFGQASRLEGVTPADITLLAVLLKKWKASRAA